MTTAQRPDQLLAPFQMGDLALSNRVVLAPMTRARAGAERLANPLMAEHYAQRAGAGLLITDATTISPQANGWVGSPGIYNDAQAESWRQVVDAVHAKGTPIFLQLWHTGRASHSTFHGGDLPVAPSAIAMAGEGVHTPEGKLDHEVPRALDIDELPGIVADYAAAARRAKEVGFDGVEIHSANGYLLDEFLQSRTNHREDAYGGSIENRFRLLREVVEAVTAVFPANRVAVRLSPNGVFNDMGSPDYRETVTYAVKQLDAFGLAYLHVMDGLGFGFHDLGEPVTLDELRPLFRGPLMGNCGYDPATANAAIERGAADMIAIGRPFISNPDLVERLANGWDLAPDSDPTSWYAADGGAEGYNDYPTFAEAAKA
ncbi:MAG: N-ethylmaleimide reductase [Bacteroidia bacterium]|jgi:N-ethylmaleimide reductase